MNNFGVRCIVIDEKSPFIQEQFESLEEFCANRKAICEPIEIKQTKAIKFDDSIWSKYLEK